MPIRPELRPLYGAAHRAYRLALIAVHGAHCMACGAVVARYLNLAHTTHDPKAWQLVALWCPTCHARHDAPHRLAIWRRNRAAKAGQLWLLPEIEWAPYPAWMIPRDALMSTQGRMFE